MLRLLGEHLVDARLQLGRDAREGQAALGLARRAAAAEAVAPGRTATPGHYASPRTGRPHARSVPLAAARPAHLAAVEQPRSSRGLVLLDVGEYLRVAGLGRHQLRVGTVGHDAAVLEQQHPLGEPDGGETVGDDQRRPTAHQRLERVVDLLLDVDVDRAGGVVEDEDRAG